MITPPNTRAGVDASVLDAFGSTPNGWTFLVELGVPGPGRTTIDHQVPGERLISRAVLDDLERMVEGLRRALHTDPVDTPGD